MKNNKEKEEKQLWDIFVRIFHWTLVALVLIAFISSEDGGPIHVRVGFAILLIVFMRIIWGFIGTKHARFTDFVKGPAKVYAYLKGLLTGRPSYWFGHNPAGGLMIVVILLTLLAVGFTGIKTRAGERAEHALSEPGAGSEISLVSSAYASSDNLEHGRYERGERKHGYEGRDGRGAEGANGSHELWEEVHEFFAYLLLVLITVHIVAVLMTWVVYGENLIKSMITGRKAVLDSGGRAQ